jgi:pyridoxal phosphate enzyme (YggS family)
MENVRDNVRRVRDRIQRCLERCGRAQDRITVVGITKTWEADMVEALLDAGIEHIGENRVQELLAKHERIERPCQWHLVGHLQRNKAAKVVGPVACIQSLDSMRLAGTLDRICGERGVRATVYMQINTSGEGSKHGFDPEEAVERADELGACGNLDVAGLMTIGPTSMDPADTRRCFRQLFDLRESIRRSTACKPVELSMGMTGDFETAIEEGATVLRLGRILTGERLR